MPFEIEVADAFVDTRETGTDDGFYRMKSAIYVFLIVGRFVRSLSREQALGKEEQVEDACDGHKDTHFPQFEHAEALQTGYRYLPES